MMKTAIAAPAAPSFDNVMPKPITSTVINRAATPDCEQSNQQGLTGSDIYKAVLREYVLAPNPFVFEVQADTLEEFSEKMIDFGLHPLDIHAVVKVEDGGYIKVSNSKKCREHEPSRSSDIQTDSKQRGRLGHTQLSTTNRYVHALRDADEAAAQTFEILINPQNTEEPKNKRA